MRNYMKFIKEGTKIYYKRSDNEKPILCSKEDPDAICYTALKEFNYADDKTFSYPNNPIFINIINNQIQTQLLLLSYLYQNNLIPEPKNVERNIVEITAIIGAGALIGNSKTYQVLHETLSVYHELPSFLILDFLIAGLIIIPKICDYLYRKEIAKFISKLDLYYTNQPVIDNYLDKSGNDAIREVENTEMSKLVKILHESKNNLH